MNVICRPCVRCSNHRKGMIVPNAEAHVAYIRLMGVGLLCGGTRIGKMVFEGDMACGACQTQNQNRRGWPGSQSLWLRHNLKVSLHRNYVVFCFAKMKVTKEKATPVRRRFAVPCVAQLVRRLRNSRYALRQSSPTSPDQFALLGGAQGKEKRKSKTKLMPRLRGISF